TEVPMPFNPQRYRAPERVNLPDRRWPDRALTEAPTWCSVDLRDGNQALPDPMGHDRKRALLELLVRVGFKQIELGFPSASQTDFDFIRWALTSGALPADAIPQVITQAREPLIVRTFASIAGAERAIVHLYNSTSELQRRVVFGKSKQEILDLAVQGTLWVKREAEKMPETQVIFQYSPESFTGTELDYALEVCDAVAEAWDAGPARPMIVNLPTTVEMTTPNVFADRIEWFERHRQRREHVTLSVHCHNDRGTGVASAAFAIGRRHPHRGHVARQWRAFRQRRHRYHRHESVFARSRSHAVFRGYARGRARRRGSDALAGAPQASLRGGAGVHGIQRLAPGCHSQGHQTHGTPRWRALRSALLADRPRRRRARLRAGDPHQ